MVIMCVPFGCIADTPPPNNGNWIIDDQTTISNDNIILIGDLIVEDGGELVFYNVDLKFNCQAHEEFKLKVKEGGRMSIYDSTVSSNTNYDYGIDVHSKGEFNIYNSTIEDYSTASYLSVDERDIITFFLIVIIIVAIFVGMLLSFVLFGYMATRKHRRIATTHTDSLIGKEGMVLETVLPNSFKGKVRVESRIWSATSDETIQKDEKINVVGHKGINVIVEKSE
jgi:membrane protein implicated in regulation of membrane protease activity